MTTVFGINLTTWIRWSKHEISTCTLRHYYKEKKTRCLEMFLEWWLHEQNIESNSEKSNAITRFACWMCNLHLRNFRCDTQKFFPTKLRKKLSVTEWILDHFTVFYSAYLRCPRVERSTPHRHASLSTLIERTSSPAKRGESLLNSLWLSVALSWPVITCSLDIPIEILFWEWPWEI